MNADVDAAARIALVGDEGCAVAVDDPSAIGEARRRAADFAQRAGLDATVAGALAIGVTEAATNLLRHAGGGTVLLGGGAGAGAGVEVLAVDRGPGIRDLAQSLRDGYSTAGTAGNGLGAMRRLASRFDLWSVPGLGTALRLWFGEPAPARRWLAGAVCVPKPGEEISGDAWALRGEAAGCIALVADGLGHGPDAARAARRAAESALAAEPWPGAEDWMARAHVALRPTRGAAIGVAELDAAAGHVRYAGVGNVVAAVVDGGRARHLVSHNGIVGHEMRKVLAFAHAMAEPAVLVMHSDGVGTRWSLDAYPGLALRHPALVAAVLWRDHARGRDDATVLVVRRVPAGAPAQAAAGAPS